MSPASPPDNPSDSSSDASPDGAVSPREARPNERRNARQKALQAVYQWDLAEESMREVENQFRLHQDMRRVDMIYFADLLRAVETQSQALDTKLEPCVGRPLTELDPIERCALRLGGYELFERHDIPLKVVINEWVSLTKRFGADQGHKFVNGVMDCVAREARALEFRSISDGRSSGADR